MPKKLLIVLYGEPRGIGNDMSYPGTNQLDVLLNSLVVHSNFDKIHIHWCLTDSRAIVYNKWVTWDNSYTIDKNGKRWNCTTYMKQEDIAKNVHNQMVEYKKLYGNKLTYFIGFRDKQNTYRWGADYYNCFKYSINHNFDFTIVSRPDLNIGYEEERLDNNYNLLRDIVNNPENYDYPFVMTPRFYSNTTIIEGKDLVLDVPSRGFEIMLFNSSGVKLLEPFLKVSAINNNSISDMSDIFPRRERDVSSFASTMVAERFWPILLNSMSAINKNFAILDSLPWYGVMRDHVKRNNIPDYFDIRYNKKYRLKNGL